MTLHRYGNATDAYINPSIIEERKLNIASMDVFSRLMMDRIIFLGVPIDDDVANIIQAQLLYLSSVDDQADISLYINTPGGVGHSGLGIYDTMQLITPDVATICTGMAASMGSVLLAAGAEGKRSALPHSRVMIHQPLGGARGQASDIMIAAQEIEKNARVAQNQDEYKKREAELAEEYNRVDAEAKAVEAEIQKRQSCGRRIEGLIGALEEAREDFTESLWGSMVEKVTVFEDGLVFMLTSGEEVKVAPC